MITHGVCGVVRVPYMAQPRLLSELLTARCQKLGLSMEAASSSIGEPPNAISRWVAQTQFPSPAKYEKIADFLDISLEEMGAALALDRLDHHRRKLSQ